MTDVIDFIKRLELCRTREYRSIIDMHHLLPPITKPPRSTAAFSVPPLNVQIHLELNGFARNFIVR